VISEFVRITRLDILKKKNKNKFCSFFLFWLKIIFQYWWKNQTERMKNIQTCCSICNLIGKRYVNAFLSTKLAESIKSGMNRGRWFNIMYYYAALTDVYQDGIISGRWNRDASKTACQIASSSRVMRIRARP